MDDRRLLAELPPVPWVRERDVDLLLAHLLSTETSFLRWILVCSISNLPEGSTEEVEEVFAVVNYGRPEARTEASGETDVLAEARLVGGRRLLVSIENKVWATAQKNQGARHRAFVEGEVGDAGFAVLLAPRGWIAGHQGDIGDYHGTVSLEQVSEWCDDRRFDFHAAVLRQACVRPASDLAPDLQLWHDAVDQLLQREFALRLTAQQYVRTRNVGQAKPNRWLVCHENTLTSIGPGIRPYLVLRPSSTNHPTRAVIDVRQPPSELADRIESVAASDGMVVRRTPVGTLLIERHVPLASGWSVADPFANQVEHLRLIGEAASELRSWWDGVSAALN